MNYLRIKNWTEFQHYRDRLPPWIKLHRALLTDYHFLKLSDEAKGHLIMLWLLASQMDGRIPNDAEWIKDRIGAKKPVNLQALIAGGWLLVEQDASKTLAPCKQDAIVETEAYKATEAETDSAPKRPELPPWVPPDAWKDWLAFRKAGKGWTYRAETLCLRELTKLYEAGHDPTAVLEQSIMRGWTGLFPLKKERAPPADWGARADLRAQNMAVLTGKVKEGAIDGVAERVGGATVLTLPGELREQDGDDVGGSRPPRSASGVG